jgi:hypothetical protein
MRIKIIGHIILSVVLSGVIPAIVMFGYLGLSDTEIDIGSPTYNAVWGSSLFIVGAALIAQWHRRVSISKRLLSFVVVGVIIAFFALLNSLLSLEVVLLYALSQAALVGQLVMLGTIETPWPIPVVRLWRGEIGMARTYWIWCTMVLGSISVILSAILLEVYHFTGSSFLIALRVAVSLVFSCFLVVSLWRSARNNKGPRRWRFLARTACVLFGIFALTNLGGLLAEVPFFKATNAGDPTLVDEMAKSYFRGQAR